MPWEDVMVKWWRGRNRSKIRDYLLTSLQGLRPIEAIVSFTMYTWHTWSSKLLQKQESNNSERHTSVFTFQRLLLIFDQYLTERESHRSQGEHRSQAAGAVKSMLSVSLWLSSCSSHTDHSNNNTRRSLLSHRRHNTEPSDALSLTSNQIYCGKTCTHWKPREGAAALSGCCWGMFTKCHFLTLDL